MAFWGKSKSAGKGAKGKFGAGWSAVQDSWSSQPQWQWDADAWESSGWKGKGNIEVQEKTTRLVNKFQLTQNILRPSADVDGSVFVRKSKNTKMKDTVYLEQKNMMEMMTADTSHIIRRPGIGLSEFAGSLSSALDMLSAIQDHDDDVGIKELTTKIRSSGKLMDALFYLNNKNEVERDNATVRQHMEAVCQFFIADGGHVVELLTKVATCSSRIYVGAMSAIQAGTAFSNPDWWSDKIPSKYTSSSAAKKWQAEPNESRRMYKALAAIYDGQDEELQA